MPRIDVIATTLSGSISDWGKVKRIIPLFAQWGYDEVKLHAVDSHADARQAACSALRAGGKICLSAGGSGTFRAVLEGCLDSQVDLTDIRLGFLRKGSADLIGKVLKMPDDIEEAIAVFAASLASDTYLWADILRASSPESPEVPRHFIGYGGAGLFGRIPHFTENRCIRLYKGFLGQCLGDMGPFYTGLSLALLEKIMKSPFTKKQHWQVIADGTLVAAGVYQALILVNGYLGPDLAFSDKPLGSGEFYLFGIKDRGVRHLFSQIRQAGSGAISKDPQRWGLESFCAQKRLELLLDSDTPFPVNVDGSTFMAKRSMSFERVGNIPLIRRSL